MMNELEHQLTELLRRTSNAHGQYETTVLHGVYDTNWAPWYADWAIRNGLNERLGTHFDAAALGKLLFEINEDHGRDGRGLTWAEYTARRLAAMFATAKG